MIFVIVVFLVAASIRNLRPDERGVVFRLGLLQSVRGPRVVLLAPILDKMCASACARLTSSYRNSSSSPATASASK
jgi:regulator of protease activity HflC (stomatin/prohibitin superfamily)